MVRRRCARGCETAAVYPAEAAASACWGPRCGPTPSTSWSANPCRWSAPPRSWPTCWAPRCGPGGWPASPVRPAQGLVPFLDDLAERVAGEDVVNAGRLGRRHGRAPHRRQAKADAAAAAGAHSSPPGHRLSLRAGYNRIITDTLILTANHPTAGRATPANGPPPTWPWPLLDVTPRLRAALRSSSNRRSGALSAPRQPPGASPPSAAASRQAASTARTRSTYSSSSSPATPG